MKQIHKIRALFWFYLGDICSRLLYAMWICELYQYSMWKSVQIDDKYDLKIWNKKIK